MARPACQATTSALVVEVGCRLEQASGLDRLRDLRVRSWLAECREALEAAADRPEDMRAEVGA